MAATIKGTRISLTESNDSIVLNCPIKRIQYASGTPTTIIIDGNNFYLSGNNTGLSFNSLHGYPGGTISVGEISSPVALNISEIGDVLNPNYFKEVIRNWNGQGTTAVDASETEASPTVAKATRSKKAEVTE